ncbi:hypothetical protein ERJ75_001717100 [Trypanosoma vivax]|nr:hypothetical protein ERJ75_001717100 [Trypanosoma vivax]
MAVEEFREAGRLLVGTIYLLAKEGSDLHCARKCARDFIEDDSKCDRRTVSPDLPAAKNGVEEGMQKCEEESNHSCMTVFERVVPFVEAADKEEGATIKAVQGAVASFGETGRQAGHVGELGRIRGEKAVVACEVEEEFSIVRQFFIALKSIAVARELKEWAEVTSGQTAAYGVVGNITPCCFVEEMCGTASRVAVNATDAIPPCYPLPHTFAQPRPVVQGARLCEQDIANERAVLVHTTVGNIKLSFPNMSEWARVSTDMCGKSVNAPADIVPRCETCNVAVDYCSALVKEFESSVSRSDSERERLGTELGGVFELIAAAETKLKEAEEVVEVVEKEGEHCFCFQAVRGDCLLMQLKRCGMRCIISCESAWS